MKTTAKDQTQAPESSVLYRRIGSTHYRVGIHFNPNAQETLNEKVLRLTKNDLQSAPQNATMKPLQADWLSERSSA